MGLKLWEQSEREILLLRLEFYGKALCVLALVAICGSAVLGVASLVVGGLALVANYVVGRLWRRVMRQKVADDLAELERIAF